MTTKVKKPIVRSERAKRVRSKLVARSSSSGKYVNLSARKQALETKLKRLRSETSGTVQVLADA